MLYLKQKRFEKERENKIKQQSSPNWTGKVG